MRKTKTLRPKILEKNRPLQLGFIPVSDCAPVVFARESGLFEKYDLQVELRRETTWANVRDKIICGALDAAHAPATLPFLTNLGLDSDQCACVAGLVLSLQGNAIAISRGLRKEGVRDAASLRDLIYRDWGRKWYTFAVPFPYSPPYFLLQNWLKSGGIVPQVEVRIIALSPTEMFPTLKLGYIDGYCVGEPWTSLALDAQVGACVATSAELAPLHPEKVLLVRREFAQKRASEHERMIAALLEACAFCDRPENRPLLAEMLAQPHYVNAPAGCLKHGLPGSGNTSSGFGSSIFHRHDANDPSDDKAAWLVGQLHQLMENQVLINPSVRRISVLKKVFRHDIFERARTIALAQTQAIKAEAGAPQQGAGNAQSGSESNHPRQQRPNERF